MSELTPQPIDADDPGLTAYALGELEGPEASRYRAAVAASAELQAIVAEIQAEACLLTNELAREPQIPITAERREEIAAQAGKSGAVAVTQKRAYRFSRRVAVAAASVALIPGAWYAFQATFPRLQRSPVIARQEPPETSKSYLTDDVQYFPETGELFGARDVAGALSKYKTKLKSLPATDPTAASEGVRRESEKGETLAAQVAQPSPMIDGPGLPIKGLERQTQSQQQLVPSFHRNGIFKAEGKESDGAPIPNQADAPNLKKVPYISRLGRKQAGGARSKPSESKPQDELKEPQNRISFGVGIDGPPKGNPSAGLPNLLPPTSQAKDKEDLSLNYRGRITSRGNNIASQFGDFTPPFGGGRKYATPSESKPKDVPLLVETRTGSVSPEARQWFAENRKKSKSVDPKSDSKEGEEDGKSSTFGIIALSERKPESPDITADPYLGVPQHLMEREGWKTKPNKLAEAGPTTGEAYQPIYENAFITPQEQQLSTFSIDVDTASYANLRRFVQGGQLPPPDAVRIEELVNYFSYQYPQPQDGRPFSVQTDIAACPWQPGHQLVRIGLKGKEIPKEQRSPTNLVFLVDVSGSMQAQNKLPLVRESLKTLVNQLDERDKVAIVTYAGEAGVRLPSTSVAQKEVVLSAIDGLGAGGSTNGAAGINTAYDIAAQEFLEKGTNRVILCTDGDFNVGVTSDDALVKMIQTRAKGGVFLSVFGFGMGNLKDAKLEQLADKGNGQYGYIDDQQEANKVFVQELMGTLVTIAKDVKIQIDFNKDTVASYRLVGYENRVMAAEDFHDDKKDAGEIGAGHTVTALYQIVPIKDLKADAETRWLTVKLRYKQPDAATSVLMESPLVGQPGQLKLAPSDFQFAAGVAACGMLLRHSQHAGQANWGLVKELAQSGLSYDPHGHRRAFIGLAAQAESLMGQFYPEPRPVTDSTVGGKYKSLLRRLHAPTDAEKYGQFNEFGHSDRKAYAGAENLPEGYWVYAAPYWYIWAETTAK